MTTVRTPSSFTAELRRSDTSVPGLRGDSRDHARPQQGDAPRPADVIGHEGRDRAIADGTGDVCNRDRGVGIRRDDEQLRRVRRPAVMRSSAGARTRAIAKRRVRKHMDCVLGGPRPTLASRSTTSGSLRSKPPQAARRFVCEPEV